MRFLSVISYIHLSAISIKCIEDAGDALYKYVIIIIIIINIIKPSILPTFK